MPEHVDRMIGDVADGGADDQTAVFPSRTWQRFWDGFEEGDRQYPLSPGRAPLK